jgi:hypothetical protein
MPWGSEGVGFVTDASATLPWCFEDEATPETEALLERSRTTVVHVQRCRVS